MGHSYNLCLGEFLLVPLVQVKYKLYGKRVGKNLAACMMHSVRQVHLYLKKIK